MVLEFLDKLLSADFMPHGHCFLWLPDILWLHVVSDSLIALAYFSIPATLFYFGRHRPDLPYRWMLYLFAGFIVACGITHLVSIWTLWIPTYRLEGVIKAVTAAVSMTTAILLVPIVPKALGLRSPAELEAANHELERHISERRRVEQQLRESEQRFRLLLESVGDYAIFMLDVEGRVASWNHGARRIKGYTEAEILGRHLSVFYTEDDVRDGKPDRTLAAAAAAGRFETEGWRVRKDGSRFWASAVVTAIRDERGEPLGFAKIVCDTTERKRAEDRLLRQSRLIGLLGAVATAANEATSVAQVIQTCLDRVCEFCRWPVGHAYLPAPDSPHVLRPSGLWHLDEPERFADFRRVTEATQLPPGTDLPGRVFQTGRPAWITDVNHEPGFLRNRWAVDIAVKTGFAFPIRIGNEVAGVLEFFSPEPLPVDDALIEMSAHLGAQIGHVLERKRAQEAVAQARDAALEASRLKSAFLANMSHEIRTPLNVILGYNAIIAERFPEDSHERSLLEGVDRASKRLVDTIHGILDLSKIETGTFQTAAVPLEVAAVLRRVVEEAEPLARDKSLSFRCALEENEVWILFDEYCLTHALTNLVQNAVKFTEKGEVSLRLYRDGEWGLCIDVRDTGIGIDKAFLPRLFAAFTQEDSGYTRRFEGAGLGLALARKYLELSGARLTVESRKGEGSAFTIHFSKDCELWTTEGAKERPLMTSLTESGSASPPTRQPAVLLVEDDPDTLAYMRTLLGSRYEIFEASSGEQVRSQIEANADRVAIVLMDLSLRGEEDGLMITRYLRRQERWKDLPIIAVTAHAFPDDRARALAAGCNGYMAKPFGHRELLAMMEELLSRASGSYPALH